MLCFLLSLLLLLLKKPMVMGFVDVHVLDEINERRKEYGGKKPKRERETGNQGRERPCSVWPDGAKALSCLSYAPMNSSTASERARTSSCKRDRHSHCKTPRSAWRMRMLAVTD